MSERHEGNSGVPSANIPVSTLAVILETQARSIENLTRNNEELTRKNEEVTREKEELTREKEDLTKEKEELTREKEELTREKEELTREKEELTREKEELTRVKEEPVEMKREIEAEGDDDVTTQRMTTESEIQVKVEGSDVTSSSGSKMLPKTLDSSQVNSNLSSSTSGSEGNRREDQTCSSSSPPELHESKSVVNQSRTAGVIHYTHHHHHNAQVMPPNHQQQQHKRMSQNNGLEDTSSSSDSGESFESDWGSGGRDQDGNARKKAKRAARNRSSSPTRASTATATKCKRVKREKNSDSDDTSGEPRAGTSSACLDTPPSEAKTKPKKKRVVAEVGGLDEIQESFRPAEWFAEVIPKRSPYFPQLGDELVYFRQGHELYVRQVESFNIYQMDKKMRKSLPYVQDPDLPAEISVRVVHLAFELKPPRLVNLKLERVDWNSGSHTWNSFNVHYHDLASSADFLVLRQIYDKSVRYQWHADDRFRCMMDETWWFGTVLAKQPYDSKYDSPNFQCYSIIWDGEDQEPEQLSPWDMEIIPDDFFVPDDSKDGVPATDEEVRSSLYEVRPEDWEPYGDQDAECRRISALVESVMNLAIAEAFLTPVDLNAWPEYAYEIAYPMDLSTIKARLDNLFYRRAPAIFTDVERIRMNAAKFNEPNSDIVKHARVVTKLLQEIVENEDFGNVSEAYHRLMASVSEETAGPTPKKSKVRRPNTDRSSPEASGSGGSGAGAGPARIVTRKSVSTRNLRTRIARSSTRSRESRSSDDSCRPWKQRCKELLSLVWNQSDAVHFRHPVNLADYPDYDQVIETPMSLQSIREDLAGDNYETPMDFHKDMMLILENSRTYNTDPRSQIRLMTIRLKSFYEEKYKRIMSDVIHIPISNPENVGLHINAYSSEEDDHNDEI